MGGFDEFLPWIFARGEGGGFTMFTMFLVKKRLFKIKYGFESSISNVDLGLFYPKNQQMFSFVTFWFC